MGTIRRWLLAVVMGLVAHQASAQYYTWGADAPMRWQQMKGHRVSVIAPDTAQQVAARTLHYIHAVQPSIAEGFRYEPLKIPFVIHPENMASNGLVMYLPKRVEFLSAPAIESYSMPWIKQLVAHEYRHAAQYANLNRGVPRVLSWFLGEQGSVTSLLFMPLWALEGDAVMNETLMSSYGRGLQPSFSMGYRALGEQIGRDHRGRVRKNIDRWFCGSYRDYIPDHYELGYQLSTYAYDRYGENVWNKVGRYGVRNPYLFATTHLGLKKYYDTSVRNLFTENFATLNALWAPLAEVEEQGHTLVEMVAKNYTTYRWPLQWSEAEVLAVKEDLARTARLVTIDAEGTERVVAHVGNLTSRPALHEGVLYWTQYRRSQLFEEREGSQLWMLDPATERPKQVRGVRQALYPTSSEEGLAWVEYRPEGRYALMVERQERVLLPIGVELHGLAWEQTTKAFYTIVTDDDGMCLARIDAEGLHPLHRPAYITLSNLRAADGHLYFGSIASGRDEVHCYDLMARREYRLSQSKYGAFDPAPSGDGVLITRYDRRGYRVERLEEPLMEPVEARTTPLNVVNPSRRGWATINLDTVRYTRAVAARQAEESPAKRYRQLWHMPRIHSWAPIAFNPYQVIDEHEIEMNLGATLLSQNLLSNTEGYLSYGWSNEQGSVVDGGVRYNGLGVVLSLDARYGGDRLVYGRVSSYDEEKDQVLRQPLPTPETYYAVGLGATLPLLFDRGSHVQGLTLAASWSYSNSMVSRIDRLEWNKEGVVTNLDALGYEHGLHRLAFSAGFSDQAILSHRDFLPRLGFSVVTRVATEPSNDDFANLWSLYGNHYLPGVAPHNSLQLSVAVENSSGGYSLPSGYRPLAFNPTLLVPRGFSSAEFLSENYRAFSANYRLPLCYPEGGIPSVLYIKRIRLGVGYDTASFDYLGSRIDVWSGGGELSFDFNVLRMPASATSSLTLSVFRTSKSDTWISASLGLPF
ncbi:MAG: hypothetical protein IJF77_05685 [Alistipes sp.]|nr:hypothetical protein [Alistipes sp.]